MGAYILRRLWQMIPTLAGVILLVFFLFNWFGGDPAQVLGGQIANPEQIAGDPQAARRRTTRGTQLWIFVKQVFTFDLGQQLGHRRGGLATSSSRRLPATLTIMVPVLILETVLGDRRSDDGRLRARLAHRPRHHDRHARWRCRSSFLVYIIVFQWLFGFHPRLVPGAGLERELLEEPHSPTRVLPIMLAVFVGLAPQLRLYRCFFLDEINQDYVRTARAKGLSARKGDVEARAAQRDDPDPDQRRGAAAGRLRRLVPARDVLLDSRPGPRNHPRGRTAATSR